MSLKRADSMHSTRGSSSLDARQQHSNDDSNQDSGLGEDCSNDSCSSSSYSAAGPTSFATTTGGSGGTQKLSREMASMHIERMKEKEDDLMDIFNDDENARDCFDSSFSMMPPPALPTRRVLGDIKNSRVNSPVSSKRFSRNDTMPALSAHSTGGLRNRKRMNDSTVSESPFGVRMGGKRWRVAESIDEHSETASTSFAPRTHSVDCRGEEKTAVMTSSTRHSFHRVQSTSVLEMGSHYNDENLPAPLEVNYVLPIDPALEKADSDVYRRIGAGQLSHLMRTMGADFEKSYVLIDCRYPYEYEGGHIKGATNVFDPLSIDARFFSMETSLLRKEEKREGGEGGEKARKIPIFYCEFSQKRGPSMALAVRAFDRLRNSWPVVDHAEMYVLNGGYKGFHKNAEDNGHGDLCSPFSYIQMEDPKYKSQMDKFRHHKSRNLLSFSSTVSRLPFTTTTEAKQVARRLAASQQESPMGAARRVSRRVLTFDSSPLRPAPFSRLPNPQFS